MARRLILWLVVGVALGAMAAARLTDDKQRHGPAPDGGPVVRSTQ